MGESDMKKLFENVSSFGKKKVKELIINDLIESTFLEKLVS